MMIKCISFKLLSEKHTTMQATGYWTLNSDPETDSALVLPTGTNSPKNFLNSQARLINNVYVRAPQVTFSLSRQAGTIMGFYFLRHCVQIGSGTQPILY